MGDAYITVLLIRQKVDTLFLISLCEVNLVLYAGIRILGHVGLNSAGFQSA